MELSRNDLLRLLSVLEGELQAREVLIAILRNEQTKRLLYPNSCPKVPPPPSLDAGPSGGPSSSLEGKGYTISPGDPYAALSRDATLAFDSTFDESSTRFLFNMNIRSLNHLIHKQNESRTYFRNLLQDVNEKYNSTVTELEEERNRREKFDRIKILEENESHKREICDLKNKMSQTEEAMKQEAEREKKMVLNLLTERKQLIVKLIEEKQRNNELMQVVMLNKTKISEMIEGLEEESKRSLQMELDLEKTTQELQSQLKKSESQNRLLLAQMDKLRKDPRSSVTSDNLVTDSLEQNLSSLTLNDLVTVSTSPKSQVSPASPAPTAGSSTTILSISMPTKPSPMPNSHHHPHHIGTIMRQPKVPQLSMVNSIGSINCSTSNSPSSATSSPPFDFKGDNSSLPTVPVLSTLPATNATPTGSPSVTRSTTLATGSSSSSSSSSTPVILQTKRLSTGTSMSGLRGAPPPVPPNKPVLPANVLKEKSKQLQANLMNKPGPAPPPPPSQQPPPPPLPSSAPPTISEGETQVPKSKSNGSLTK